MKTLTLSPGTNDYTVAESEFTVNGIFGAHLDLYNRSSRFTVAFFSLNGRCCDSDSRFPGHGHFQPQPVVIQAAHYGSLGRSETVGYVAIGEDVSVAFPDGSTRLYRVTSRRYGHGPAYGDPILVSID